MKYPDDYGIVTLSPAQEGQEFLTVPDFRGSVNSFKASKKRPDITGQRFGDLVAVEFAGREKKGSAWGLMWSCICDCGGKKIVGRSDLRAGRVKSCGCRMSGPKKGSSRRQGYTSYASMISRCCNPRFHAGKRGEDLLRRGKRNG